MKTGIALFTLAFCGFAADRPVAIPSGSTIYVDPAHGFDQLLAAAFQAKHVPLRVVTAPEKADYEFDSAIYPVFDVVEVRSGPFDSITGDTVRGAAKLSSKAGTVVWTHDVPQRILKRGGKSIAEDCAKRLKDLVAKSSKP